MKTKILAVRSMNENKLFVIPLEIHYIDLINQGFQIYKDMKENNVLSCKPILVFPDIRGITMFSLNKGIENKIGNGFKVSIDSIENMFLNENQELFYDFRDSHLVNSFQIFENTDHLFENLNDKSFLSRGFFDLVFEDDSLHIKSNNQIENEYYLSEAMNSKIFL
ncbi:hypothetical protein IA01_02810 [Flavobacterium psychrophilum]|uniref:Uncharacterized protein n=12 Tax=Flavobacterium psychrophilum TaxID=96345 RepID=A6GX39_FLAPJ|nr:hypothetical protein [Flavobacterium psychrophilum]AIG29464.1 hypothetical protein IA03_02790 [Flavobacterium psychrophilum]AIG31741.1 hypothetical protein IA01_02810 [Flavobacterium psychrophilum]AIG33895.1 hypothetical protein IA02_02195 [Flavobacterium psychrophilum]AIG36258.1 hypothetical protein IA04_02700 [Flavobacterium psychrophilum]AIG38524.1 hypothetical protein IA05_02790 [Flavobacterium psychrophilum]